MSLLTDRDLKEMKCSTQYEWQVKDEKITKIFIAPYSEDSLTPVGYDLRVGSDYVSVSRGRCNVDQNNPLVIEPGDTVLITTLEEIKMPINRTVSALITSKVRQSSKGLSNISTTIDPDWQGKLLITLNNFLKEPVSLNYKETFCTVVFFENKSPSEKESRHDPGRKDLLEHGAIVLQGKMAEEKNIKKQARNRNLVYQIAASVCIIPLSIGAGFLFFKKEPTLFIATAGIGITLSQTAITVISSLNKKDEE